MSENQEQYEAEQALRAAQAQIVAAHPSVAPLADLIISDTIEGMEALAVDIERRLAAGQNPEHEEPENEDPKVTTFTGFAPPVEETIRPDFTMPTSTEHGRAATTQEKWDAFFDSVGDARNAGA